MMRMHKVKMAHGEYNADKNRLLKYVSYPVKIGPTRLNICYPRRYQRAGVSKTQFWRAILIKIPDSNSQATCAPQKRTSAKFELNLPRYRASLLHVDRYAYIFALSETDKMFAW